VSAEHISEDDIYKLIVHLPRGERWAAGIRGYEALYLGASLHGRYGIEVPRGNEARPILLLAGTSIPFSDRMDLVKFLFQSGCEVASISNQIGGPLDVTINPKKDRVDSLRHYLQHLTREEQVTGVDIVAQSYSAFEVIRLLSEDPGKYREVVRSVVFINPPGFNRNTGVVKHCSRFVWHHVLKGYTTAVRLLLSRDSEPRVKSFHKREAVGITTWLHKTVRNPARTLKEVLDIVSYLIKDDIVRLREQYGYDINVFLQSGDQILPLAITLGEIEGVLPSHSIKVVPGGHNDVFFQQWQRNALFDFLKEIKSRSGAPMEPRLPIAAGSPVSPLPVRPQECEPQPGSYQREPGREAAGE